MYIQKKLGTLLSIGLQMGPREILDKGSDLFYIVNNSVHYRLMMIADDQAHK